MAMRAPMPHGLGRGLAALEQRIADTAMRSVTPCARGGLLLIPREPCVPVCAGRTPVWADTWRPNISVASTIFSILVRALALSRDQWLVLAVRRIPPGFLAMRVRAPAPYYQ